MTSLLIDIGNSRVKWARLTRGRRSRQRSEALRGDGAKVFRALLAGVPSRTQVLAVNVAGRAVERALVAAARAAGLATPRLLRSSPAAAGITNGYDEAWRLGADRWAALIGARHATGARPALCVVDVGTAMTIDFVDGTGLHHGGYIVPGPTLAAQSLLQGTSGILRRSRGRRANGRAGSWPRATRPAVEDGSREACAAMILRSFGAARDEFGRATRLVLTGGGAADVVSLLPKGVLHQPDLVLHGVQVAFGGA